MPIAMAFRPELVLVSAGFDAHIADPLGGMNITTQGFAQICSMAKQVAQEHAQGKIALVLEGGYDIQAISQSVLACVLALGDKSAEFELSKGNVKATELVNVFKTRFRPYWPNL